MTKELDALGIKYSAFREPDIGYAITAIAIEPDERTKEYCNKLPTAMKAAYKGGPTSQHIDLLDRRLRMLKQVVNDMSQAEQFKQVSILEHGEAVWKRFIDLKGVLQGKGSKLQWFLPDWIEEYKNTLLKNLMDDFIIEKYTIFHDCGKPYCLTTDETGKRHFINHAEVSKKTYLAKCGSDTNIAQLIGMDMDVHLLKTDKVVEFAGRKEAATLLLAGLAEIHANAEACGGFDSDSFKIKLKHLTKKGKAICQALKKTDELLSTDTVVENTDE